MHNWYCNSKALYITSSQCLLMWSSQARGEEWNIGTRPAGSKISILILYTWIWCWLRNIQNCDNCLLIFQCFIHLLRNWYITYSPCNHNHQSLVKVSNAAVQFALYVNLFADVWYFANLCLSFYPYQTVM